MEPPTLASAAHPPHPGGERRVKVLMVDDEEVFTRMVRRNLEAEGPFEVRTEHRPVRALQAAREFRPDVILLDVIMPGRDGGEVAAELMGDPLIRGTPLIFLTAAVRRSETGDGVRRIGGRLYLSKPVSIETLVGHIHACLRA